MTGTRSTNISLAVREIERRIQRAEQHGAEAALPEMARPSGIPGPTANMPA